MKGFTKPILIAGVLAILAGLAYWDEIATKKDNVAKEKAQKLEILASASIQKIEYQKLDGLPIVLEKKGDHWDLSSPLAFPGDQEAIQRFLKQFDDLKFEKSFQASASNQDAYGLAKPKVKITMTDTTGKAQTLLIGEKSPVGYSSYFQIVGDPSIYLVSQVLATSSNKELKDFRDHSLRLPPLDAITGFRYQFAAETPIQLSLSDTNWQIKSPRELKGDKVEIDGFLNGLLRQKLVTFIDEPSSALKSAIFGQHGGSKTLVQIQFQLKDGKSQELKIIENNGEFYSELPGYSGLVILDKAIKESLKKDLNAFQDRKIFDFNSTEAKEIDRDSVVFMKEGDHWKRKDTGEEADYIRLMLVDLEFAKADEVLEPDPKNPVFQQAPLHTLSISWKKGDPSKIAIWKDPKDNSAIFIKNDKAQYFKASAQILDNFSPQEKSSAKDTIGTKKP